MFIPSLAQYITLRYIQGSQLTWKTKNHEEVRIRRKVLEKRSRDQIIRTCGTWLMCSAFNECWQSTIFVFSRQKMSWSRVGQRRPQVDMMDDLPVDHCSLSMVLTMNQVCPVWHQNSLYFFVLCTTALFLLTCHHCFLRLAILPPFQKLPPLTGRPRA